PAMATRVCTITLDSCCEVEAIEVADCCANEDPGCCIVVLSDESAMVAPEVCMLPDVSAHSLEFSAVEIASLESVRFSFSDVPDPPPLSLRERLAHLDTRLI
ncbi:MAG: hypothetical protein AAF357_11995, partial [Verrucomicrobiota bacterium]